MLRLGSTGSVWGAVLGLMALLPAPEGTDARLQCGRPVTGCGKAHAAVGRGCGAANVRVRGIGVGCMGCVGAASGRLRAESNLAVASPIRKPRPADEAPSAALDFLG